MALSAGQIKVNGVAVDLNGALVTTPYVALSASTYIKQNGLLVDPDGRVVVVVA